MLEKLIPYDPVICAASHAESLGFSIFFTGKNKKPVSKWKQYQSYRCNNEELLERWCFHRDTSTKILGYAIVTGSVSNGLYIRDFDDVDSYHQWVEKYPHFACQMPTVRTRNGYHVYGRWHTEHFTKYKNGEFRGTPKQFTIGAGSFHDEGIYYWIDGQPSYDEIRHIDPIEAGLLRAKPVKQAGDMVGNKLIYCGPTHVAELIRRHIPHGEGERNYRIGKLVSSIKKDLKIGDYNEALPIFNEWFNKSYDVIGTKDYAVSATDFSCYWKACDIDNITHDPLAEASECASVGDTLLDKLRNFCQSLAISADGNFFLSERSFGKEVNIPKTTARRVLHAAIAQGWLEVVEKGIPSATMRKATVYRLRS